MVYVSCPGRETGVEKSELISRIRSDKTQLLLDRRVVNAVRKNVLQRGRPVIQSIAPYSDNYLHRKLKRSISTPLGVVHIAHPLVYACTPLKGCNRNTHVKGVKFTPFKECVGTPLKV